MATFSAVNTTFSAGSRRLPGQEPAPSSLSPSVTSRPGAEASFVMPKGLGGDESSPNTPTRHDFAGVRGQRPLPDGPFTHASTVEKAQDPPVHSHADENNDATAPLSSVDSQDVDMGNGDDEGNTCDDDGSGNESATSDSQRPSKKKKGQRFFCTDFPPCQLSFTRSEHLARHIRKHTGERPFQCHCSRRFSRLDNLRQHAQTVHVNEEIPGDSLAAQSTRFQRQIRTDRVRPTSSRSRASTIGSQGGPSRGHSRNVSTSSIGSTASSIGGPDDTRRRPQPLAIANDASARARLTLETFPNIGGSPGPQYAYYNPSPTGYSTPTSTTFSPGNGSPQFQPAMISTPSSVPRSSVYGGNRTSHIRRLSVPSTHNPFHSHSSSYPSQYFAPMPSASSAFSPASQGFASPTSSIYTHSRRESDAEMDYRRRTWHPSTNPIFTQRPATSGLTYHQTPDEPRPAFSQQPAASQMTRLPGIESFDHAPPPASRQPSSPMMVDVNPRPPSSGRPSEAGLQSGANRPDVAAPSAVLDGHWQTAPPGPSVHGPQYAQPTSRNDSVQYVQPQHVTIPEQPATPHESKRNAWYGGPVGPVTGTQAGHATIRTSPEDSGSSDGIATPSTAHVTEFHPMILNPAGMPETYPTSAPLSDEQKAYYSMADTPRKSGPTRSDSGFHGIPHDLPEQHQQQQQTPTQQRYALQAGHDPHLAQTDYHQTQGNDMAKLEALVAVATSQNRAVEHRT